MDEEDICDSTITFLPKIYYSPPQFSASIYPNPAKHRVTLNLDAPVTDEIDYKLTDINGRVIKKGSLPLLAEKCTIDISKITSGVYLLQLEKRGKMIWRDKLLVE